MIKRFFQGSLLIQSFTTDTRSGPERLAASPWATATTPDQIIVAHILESVAKNPDDWQWNYRTLPEVDLKKLYDSYSRVPNNLQDQSYTLNGPNLSIKFYLEAKSLRKLWYVQPKVSVTKDREDSLLLDEESGEVLTVRIQKLFAQIEKLRETARKAKLEMEVNEKKWNLAESLLGMKRNEQGVLEYVKKE